MNQISGRVPTIIAGDRRELVCDMTALTALSEEVGEHWSLWLIERFVGVPTKVDGKPARKLEPLSPKDLAVTIYALLASDREDSRRDDETVKTIMRSIGLGEIARLQQACTTAVIASLGVPGKDLEVAVSA